MIFKGSALFDALGLSPNRGNMTRKSIYLDCAQVDPRTGGRCL